MTPTTGRSPPTLARVVCPFCGRLWFRYKAAGSTEETEISCPGIGCHRLITFRLIKGTVHVEAAMNRPPRARPNQ